jgi:hypothetical protein
MHIHPSPSTNQNSIEIFLSKKVSIEIFHVLIFRPLNAQKDDILVAHGPFDDSTAN